jgi:outer membrane lipoprotein-sorting protein
VLALIVLLASGAMPGNNATPKSRKADKIIRRHIEALGGEDRIKALRTLRIHGRLQREGMEFPFTLWLQRPNRSRMDIDVRGHTFIQAYDGKTVWWVNPLLGVFEPQAMPEDFARSTKRWVDFEGPLVDYQNKRHEVEYLGEIDTENGTAHEIELAHAEGDVWHVFIDADTYLEVTYTETFMGESREVTAFFYAHAEVGGVNLYHTIDGEGIDGTRYMMIFDTVEPNVEVDDAWFSMPEPD